jgi:hypothetical protein
MKPFEEMTEEERKEVVRIYNEANYHFIQSLLPEEWRDTFKIPFHELNKTNSSEI